MITEFYIYSRQAVEAMQPHDEALHIIVSIRTPGDPKQVVLRTSKTTLAVVHLSFHDMDRVVPGEEEIEPELFQHEHAHQILGAVKAHPEAQRLIVHCDAGWSRSPAVAAALSKILLGDDDYFFQRYHPNMLVYRRILEAYHGVENGNNHH